MKFKILITIKSYEYHYPMMLAGSAHHEPLVHNPGPSMSSTINVQIVEFDNYDEAEFAFGAITRSGHVPTRLYATLPDLNTVKVTKADA